ncbi:hypothetical protein ALC56_11805, partial [Trachymyrmex septentrionalis]
VYGSMILAGVLLKIGRYGLVRFLEVFYFIRPSRGHHVTTMRPPVVYRVAITWPSHDNHKDMTWPSRDHHKAITRPSRVHHVTITYTLGGNHLAVT